MDVRAFVDELLPALSATGLFERITLQTEGPIASGFAYPNDQSVFLRFYFNEVTGTTAFAVIESQQRVWGIDYDNRRGWHLHPVEEPANHVQIEPLAVSEIVQRLQQMLSSRE